MPDVRMVEKRGDKLILWMTDGTFKFANPYPNGMWVPPSGKTPTPPPGGGGAGVMITPQMIEAAVRSAGGSPANMVDTSQAIADSFNNAVNLVDPKLLSSKNRAACLVGECAHETAWFQTTTEFGGGAGQPYYPYCGRGYIQVTWDYNYRSFGQWCAQKGLITDGNQFVNNPASLADLKWAALTAVWYFSKTFSGSTLFEWCDKVGSPWTEISNAINSGNVYGTAYDYSSRANAINAALAVAPEPSAGGGGTALGGKVVDWIIAHEGMYYYSQASGRMSPDTSGYTDCSALMWYCFKQVAGINVGTWTGDQQNYGTVVKEGTGSCTTASMLPGDLVFFNWNAPTSTFDHVEMYLGKGKFGTDTICGHGGDPYYGPVEKSLAGQTGAARGGWRVRRYV